jgi:nucleoside-diphosphate-sugar epimerase
MKILVTGATGFIGNYLIRELLKDESNQVIATSRSTSKAEKFDWFSKVSYIEYDINNGINEDLYSFFYKPDQVIHLAWDNLSNDNDLAHIEVTLFDNYKFIKNMIVNGLKDVVVTGSCKELSMVNGCLSEDLNTKPSTSYGIAKDTLREFIVELNKSFSFTYKWIRIFNVYGEGQSKKSLMYLLDKAIKDKDKEFNMSGGGQLRDFLYIDDVVKNISLIANQNIYVDQVINCCSGRLISVKDLVEEHLEEKKCSMKLNF